MLRKHFRNEHSARWETERASLGVPQKEVKPQAPVSEPESFTWDGFMWRLLMFVVGGEEVILQLCSHFFSLY